MKGRRSRKSDEFFSVIISQQITMNMTMLLDEYCGDMMAFS